MGRWQLVRLRGSDASGLVDTRGQRPAGTGARSARDRSDRQGQRRTRRPSSRRTTARSIGMSTATQTDAEHAWHILVSLVMESRGDWRRKLSQATVMPFSRYRAPNPLRAEPRTLRDPPADKEDGTAEGREK